jgi:hypothetical protein
MLFVQGIGKVDFETLGFALAMKQLTGNPR